MFMRMTWGSWDNAASVLVGVRGPIFALLLALRPYFESERNLEINTHLGGRQPMHMLRLQLYQLLFYKVHSFPSPGHLTKWAVDTCTNHRKCIRDWKGDWGTNLLSTDLSPDGADWRAHTQVSTILDCKEEPLVSGERQLIPSTWRNQASGHTSHCLPQSVLLQNGTNVLATCLLRH